MIIKVNLDDYYSNLRLDAYLAEYLGDYSRSRIARVIKDKNISVNGNPQKAKYLIKEGDIISIDMKDLEIPAVLAEEIPLDILYKDEDIAVINKPIGMLVHPTANIRSHTLVNALMEYFPTLSTVNGEERAGIVHRLDYNTSGLMIVALSDKAGYKLKENFQNRDIVKKYRAIVKGNFTEKEGILEYPIGRNQYNRKLMTVDLEGKYAKTGYKVIKECKGFSYLHLDLYTGRTHQIRVHLAHINRPILGDKDYGGLHNQYSIDHQLLQSYYLEFQHPITKENMKFEIPKNREIEKYYNILFNKL